MNARSRTDSWCKLTAETSWSRPDVAVHTWHIRVRWCRRHGDVVITGGDGQSASAAVWYLAACCAPPQSGLVAPSAGCESAIFLRIYMYDFIQVIFQWTTATVIGRIGLRGQLFNCFQHSIKHLQNFFCVILVIFRRNAGRSLRWRRKASPVNLSKFTGLHVMCCSGG